MSTVAPSLFQTPGTPVDQSGPITAPLPSRQSSGQTPLWLLGTGTSRNAFELLGIRMPQASGDIAALLAEVSMNMEATVAEGRKNRTIAGFAAAAATLVSLDVASLRETATRLQTAQEEAEATRDDLKQKTQAVLPAIDQLNGTISDRRARIGDIKSLLKNDKLTPKERQALENELGATQASLAAALEARETKVIELAEIRIGSLQRQIADLKRQLAAVDPQSDEAKSIQVTIASVEGKLDTTRASLADYVSGPRTEARRDAFSHDTVSATGQDIVGLESRAKDYADRATEAFNVLGDAEMVLVGIAMRTATELRGNQQLNGAADLLKDKGIQSVFDSLMDELDRVGSKGNELLRRLEETLEDDRRREILVGTFGLIGSMSSVASALRDIADEQLPNLPIPPGPSNLSRLRLEV